ncbi:MAG: beta-ketoacyl-ACP synthase III [Pseudonocardiaceae bacterium]
MNRAAVLQGLGGWVPPTVVTNSQLAEQLDTSDGWIRTRTGIHQRHVIRPGESTGDLAVEAGRRALDSAKLSRVDVVVLATSTPDRPCPATAPEVASRLGFTGVAAFDLAAVCTGFVYALATATGLIESGLVETALVIGADTFSTILDPKDRTTRAIFGDGAGGVVLRCGHPVEHGALLGFDLGSDGTKWDLITVPAGGSRQRSAGGPAELAETYFAMRGQPVFVEAVLRMTESVRSTAKHVRWSVDEVDRFVVHQANARILAAMAEQLDAPAQRFVSNIARVGNTVAASIPLAMADAVEAGDLRAGQRVMLSGFGGGLTWGSAALTWPDIHP